MITREADTARPLIVSMSDLAASGGYYIAMAGDSIVAQPGTLTGSIGVFGGKIALGGALNKIGVNNDAVVSGPNAGIGSPFTPFTPGQRMKVLEMMQNVYDDFVEKAAESRKTTPEKLDAVAQGRVWTGQQAREKGLVDAGLGKGVSIGDVTLIAPTDLIAKKADRRVVDGVQMEFQLTPGTEAPSEMNIYFPQLRMLNVAENVTHTMHNLYTLRGAEFFLIAFAFVAVVLGTAVGALSAWRQWRAGRAFVAAVALAAAVILAADLVKRSDFGSMVGALLLAPLVAVLAAGSGFVVGRGVVLRFLGRRQRPDEEKT